MMTLVRMKRESMWGKAGKEVEVSDDIARDLVKQGAATVVEEEKPAAKRRSRRQPDNKALSATS